MKQQFLKIKDISEVTHDVLRFTLENPKQLEFKPGQAAKLAVDKDGWREEAHPFTFTSLPGEDHLEFTIKIYPDHEGVTNELSKLEVGDQIILDRVFGAIHYQGDGTFIAGGAGVTPFISIIRDLDAKDKLANNKLIFANNEEKDIILQEEFQSLLGDNFFNILADEEKEGYAYGFVDADYLKDKIDPYNEHFYVCGPPPMMDATEEALKELDVKENQITKEDFSLI